MARTHLTHYSFIEATIAWQRPFMDVVQMAANGIYPAYVVAQDWPVLNQPDLEGWVQLENMALLKSMISDSVQIKKVKHQGKWHTLVTPERKYWAAVFVDSDTYERFENEQAKTTRTACSNIDDRLLTAKEAAKRLGILPDTLSKWRQKNKGPQYLKLGGTVRYSQAVLNDYLSNSLPSS